MGTYKLLMSQGEEEHNMARTIASPLGQPAQLLENRDSMYRHIARQHPVWLVRGFSYPP